MKRILVFVVALLGGIATLSAQNIKGVVRDAKGEALIGVSIFWEGTTIGTATDVDGSYELYRVKDHNRLVAAYIGYVDSVVEVAKDAKEVDFVLSDGVGIEEVVIRIIRYARAVLWLARISALRACVRWRAATWPRASRTRRP